MKSDHPVSHNKIAETEQQTENIRKQIQTIRSGRSRGTHFLPANNGWYDKMDGQDTKGLLKAIIDHIDLYTEKREDGCCIRKIVLTIHFPAQGHEAKGLPSEKSALIVTAVLISLVSIEDTDQTKYIFEHNTGEHDS